jgi:hypothetical protein
MVLHDYFHPHLTILLSGQSSLIFKSSRNLLWFNPALMKSLPEKSF